MSAARLAERLRAAGLEPDLWSRDGAKSVDDLAREIASGETVLEESAKGLCRVVSITRVILRRGERVLIEARQQFRDGRVRVRDTYPAEKMKPGEDAADAALRCLREELGVAAERVEIVGVTGPLEQEGESPSFPGLASRYAMWDVEARVVGLPDEDFETAERADEDAVARHFWEWR